MQNITLQDVTAAVAKNRRKSIWKRIVSVLACIVVFCTTYALILPALTLERDPDCGIEEHTHTEACYVRVDTPAEQVLVCNAETLGLHIHTDGCIGLDGGYICGYSDFVVHSHNEFCFDENGLLVCTLPEIFPHTHTDGCYLMSDLDTELSGELGGFDDPFGGSLDNAFDGGFDNVPDDSLDGVAGHIHTDDCYITERGELICTMPEATTPAHIHTDECYLNTNELTCPLVEGEGHIHGEGCFDESGALLCAIPESAGHVHTPECYQSSSALICTLAETEQTHVHSDDCYAQNRVLVCEIPEEPYFIGDDTALPIPQSEPADGFAQNGEAEGLPADAYPENNIPESDIFDGNIIDNTAEADDRGEPICGMTEIILHCHGDNCFDENGAVICGMTEVLEHIHTQDCMGESDNPDDLTNLSNSDNPDNPDELTCTIAEGEGAHIHTAEGGCFDADGNLICEMTESEGHVHSAICYGNWILVCGIEEHTHTEECYPSDEPEPDPESRVVICGTEEHVHTDECIDENGVIICGIEEHTHAEECYLDTSVERETFCGKIEHTHGEECIDSNGVISCGIEEHTHGEECYVDTSAELETFCGKVEHVHSAECFDENGMMICVLEEHTHTEECYVPAEDLMPVFGEIFATAQLVESDPSSSDTMMLADMPMMMANDLRTGPHNFGPDITSASMSYWDENQNKYVDIDSDHKIKENDKVKFALKYELPEGSIDPSSKSIVYKLPEYIRILYEKSDVVRSKDYMRNVGTYKIALDGTITITFFDEYVANNATQKIDGDISFDCNLDNSKISGEDQKITIGTNVEIGPIDILPPDASDISVVKSGTQIDENGQIVYTATVSSMNGTTNPVKITDTMQNVELVSDISIKGSDGSTHTPTISKTANGFELELPQMAANSSYEITYTCKLPDGYEASKTDIDTNNTLHAESEKKNGHKTEASDDHEVKYVQQFLEKVGFRDDTGNITWRITVNAAQQDISGWTLTDLFNGSKLGSDMLVGDITMTDSDGIVTKISSLDSYKFTGSKTYTITYQTKAQASAGTSDAINKAILTDPNDPSNPVEKEHKVPAGATFEPVHKVAGDMTIDKEHDIVIIDWTVNITGPLSENWIYKDTIKYEHDGKGFLTDEQYAVLEKTVREVFGDYDVCEFKTDRSQSWGTNVITSFEFKCRKPLPAGKTISFSYQSAGRFEGGKTNWIFKNTGMINNTGGSSAEKHYKPLLQKHDKNQQNQETTTKNCKDTVDNLNWLVKITSDGLPDSDITVVEQLPEGTELVSLKFQLQPTFWDRKLEVDDNGPKNTELQIWDYSSGTLTASYTISVTKDGNNIFITIPKELIEYAGETQIEFFIEAKVDEEFLKPTDNKYVTTGTFKNTVTLTTPDDKVLDTTWQTQVVTKDTWKPPLKKEASSENNRITYQLKINQNGEDLVEGTDTLTLTDILTVDATVKDNQAHQYEVRYKLNPDSLKIYELNPDGTKGNQLNPSDYPYTYAETIHPTDPNKHLHTIKMTVDDEKPLLVEYTYIAYVDDNYQGNDGNKIYPNVSNEASLDGVVNTSNENKKDIQFELVKSEASAGTTSVTVYKHDSDNYSKPLGGAKFHLYKYDGTKYNQVKDETTQQPLVIVTNAEGIDLGKAIPTVDLNVAYYIQEFEPPSGYLLNDKPYYFMVYDGSEDALNAHPVTAPDDFSGEKLISGQLLPIPNESTTTSIRVQKIWQDKKNQPYVPQVPSITVNLKCKAYDKVNKEIVCDDVDLSTLEGLPAEYKSSITISADPATGIWQRSITGLPRYGKIGKRDVYYTYYVEEVNDNPDIEVTYSVSNPGITTGTITITNTVDTDPKHELPQTGGKGTSPITALGGSVIAITLALALIKRLQDKKVRESG